MRSDSPLSLGLVALGNTLGDPFVQARVRRAEFDKDGHLWLDLDDDTAWYRVDADASGVRVVRREPFDDDRLPLARSLARRRGEPLLEVLAWRPGRRIVVVDSDSETTVVRKGHRPSRFEAAVARHEAAIALNANGAFKVPALRGVDSATASVALELVIGLEPRLAREHASDFVAIGAGVAAMQRGVLDERFGVHAPKDELGVVDGAHGRLARACGTTLEGWDRVRTRLGELAPRRAPAPVPCHRDLHDRQFLFGEFGPALLDFDSLCLADAALDPANLLAHFALRRLQGLADSDGVRVCSEALIDGLAPHGDTSFFGRLRFYQATALLRLAAVYAVRPRWSHLGRDLVRLAWRCADDAPVAID